jgi:hypothetical protein
MYRRISADVNSTTGKAGLGCPPIAARDVVIICDVRETQSEAPTESGDGFGSVTRNEFMGSQGSLPVSHVVARR